MPKLMPGEPLNKADSGVQSLAFRNRGSWLGSRRSKPTSPWIFAEGRKPMVSPVSIG